MRLEPRDTLYAAGNSIFEEISGKLIEKFIVRVARASGHILEIELRIENDSNGYKLFLDAGLAFWEVTEIGEDVYEESAGHFMSNDYTAKWQLSGVRIARIYWEPDGSNSRISIQLAEADRKIIVKVVDPQRIDSPMEVN